MPDSPRPITDDLRCPSCGYDVYYHYPSQGVKCDHCGTLSSIPDTIVPPAYELRDLKTAPEAVMHTRRAYLVECFNCGAISTITRGYHYKKCVYCSTRLRKNAGREGMVIQPHGVLPFRIGPEETKQFMLEWAKSQEKQAVEIVHALVMGDFRASYVPVWEIEEEVEVPLREEAIPPGETRPEPQRVTYPPFFRSGLPGFPDKQLNAVAPWPNEERVPFHEAYLLGVPTYHFFNNWDKMDRELHVDTLERVKGDPNMPTGSKIDWENLRVLSRKAKLILLPVYIFTLVGTSGFRNFYVNGYTGSNTLEEKEHASTRPKGGNGCVTALIIFSILGFVAAFIFILVTFY